MPRFWRNQQRNDSSLHRKVLGSDMLYAIPPDLGTIVIKLLFFFLRTIMGYLMSTLSPLYAQDVNWVWHVLLGWSVFTKPGQVIQVQWQRKLSSEGRTDSIPFGSFVPQLLSYLHGGCWQEASPNTQFKVVNFSESIQYSCNYPGKHIWHFINTAEYLAFVSLSLSLC